MEEFQFKLFLNKRVRVFNRQNFCYKGTLKSISERGIIIDDIKEGIMFLASSDISAIKEWKGDVNE